MLKCIIVDDEPIARIGIKKLAAQVPRLELAGEFNSAESASLFLKTNDVDLVFLDIRMSGISGLEFARSIPRNTLVIFTTAFSEYAVDSYEVDAVDYLVKPIDGARFRKAVNKAIVYHELLVNEEQKTAVENAGEEHIFIRSDRRFFRVRLKDILFIEGLKDYVIIQMEDQRLITRMNIKGIHELLPKNVFLRVSRSYIVNKEHIDSFDNNDVFIKTYEIAIGDFYREQFFTGFMKRE